MEVNKLIVIAMRGAVHRLFLLDVISHSLKSSGNKP